MVSQFSGGINNPAVAKAEKFESNRREKSPKAASGETDLDWKSHVLSSNCAQSSLTIGNFPRSFIEKISSETKSRPTLVEDTEVSRSTFRFSLRFTLRYLYLVLYFQDRILFIVLCVRYFIRILIFFNQNLFSYYMAYKITKRVPS